jgi:hypothetical protein
MASFGQKGSIRKWHFIIVLKCQIRGHSNGWVGGARRKQKERKKEREQFYFDVFAFSLTKLNRIDLYLSKR